MVARAVKRVNVISHLRLGAHSERVGGGCFFVKSKTMERGAQAEWIVKSPLDNFKL